MKTYIALIVFAFAFMFFVTSCKKDQPPIVPHIDRTIRFVLYTEKNFSNNDNTISFSVFIRNHRERLFDSSLSPIQLKDIPRFPNKLMFEKKVPNDDGSDLAAGFQYEIKNVGVSWHVDSCKSGQAFKEVGFSFQ